MLGRVMSRALPVPPSGLGESGRLLWLAIVGDLAEGLELEARELDALGRACSCADRIAALEVEVNRDGVMVEGSKGQPVLHPAIPEIRQTELARLRLLGSVETDDPAAGVSSGTPAQARARRAAQARWARRDRLREMRRGTAG